MKDKYIQRVRRALMVRRRQKAEILRDLNEIFVSAAEHGESEAQVIARLGTPEEFARSMEEQLGVNRKSLLKRRTLLGVIPAGLIGLICLLFYAVMRDTTPKSVGIIGGADGPTSILVATAPLSPHTSIALLALSLLALAFAVWQAVRYFTKTRR